MTPKETQQRIEQGLKCLHDLREHWKEVLDPVNIMVADDNPSFCLLLCDTLEDLLGRRCRLFQANSGKSAIEALTRNKIDILFLDLRMPEGNGVDVLKAIGPNAPMIVLCCTGMVADAAEVRQARELGYNLVLRKTELMDDLRAIFGVSCRECLA